MANEQFVKFSVLDVDIEAELAILSMEDIASRHRREKRELQAQVQALKKSAPKNDKKKRKEVSEEVARIEKDLKERHIKELNEIEGRDEVLISRKNSMQSTDSDASSFGLAQSNNGQQGQQRISKAQRRREKKAREAREREREIEEELNLSNGDKEPKAVELKSIKEKLDKRNLALYETTSDGNCLYNAVRHQLLNLGLPALTVVELRNETAKYIRANKETVICYMTNPETNELLNDVEFEEYCDAVRDTAAWGGQVELKALSTVLRVSIEVLQATGPPTIFGDDEYSDIKLIITYHRHMYQMGEHYNSTIAKTNLTDDDKNIGGGVVDKHDHQPTNCT